MKADIASQDLKLLNYSNMGGVGKQGSNMKGTNNELVRLNEMVRELTKKNNEMSNAFESVWAENALLRQMSKVPDNFGEMIEAFKNDQKENAIYYKRKNEYMEKELKQVEEERADLKAQLRKYAGFFERTGSMDEGLTEEQRRYLQDVVMNLRENRLELPITDKSKQLQEQVIKLQAMVSTYENMVGNQRLDGSQARGGMDEAQYNTLLAAIRDQKKDLETLFQSARPQGEVKHIVDQAPPSHMDSRVENTINNINRPPRPIPGIFGDWTEANQGMSFKFGSKLNIKSYDEELAGMDVDKAKYYIAVLQLHNMESLELLAQREQEHILITTEMENLRGAYKKALSLQDELFTRHHYELSQFKTQSASMTKENQDLKTLNMELSNRVDVFEKTLTAIQTKNASLIEGRLAEMTKNSAIAETNVIKLSRKYDALETEFNQKATSWRILETDQNQREYQMTQAMNKLLEWKNDATQKLTIMMDRMRNSKPLEDFNALKSDFDLERKKYAALKANEDVLTMQNVELRSLERQRAEESDKVRLLEEEIAGIEAEYGVLHMRLSALDPIYNRHSLVFKKIATVLKTNNISPLQFFQTVDTDKSGYLSAGEFFKALESMGIQMTRDEGDQFFSFLDLDGSGQVDYQEFSRKLKRMGVVIRSKEEELVNKLWNGIVTAGLTLEGAYQIFDKKKDNSVSFNEMMDAFKTLHLDVDARTASEFFKLADVSDNGSISCAEWLYVFQRFNKVSKATVIAPDTTLDWKLDMMARLDKVIKEKGGSLEEVYNEIDNDGDGRISPDEFRRMFLKMNIRIEKKEFNNLFYAIDSNRSGVITFPEFLNYVNVAKRESERLARMKLLDAKIQGNHQMSNECKF